MAQGPDPKVPPAVSGMTSAHIQNLIDPLISDQLERRKIAGAVVVVVKDGAVILSKGYGYADLATQRGMGQDTIVSCSASLIAGLPT